MSWVCEYHYGNGDDTTELSYHETRAGAVERGAVKLTYSFGDNSRFHELIDEINNKGFSGDGNTNYRPEGLTCAIVYHREEAHIRGKPTDGQTRIE
jgi:hypothetical protein